MGRNQLPSQVLASLGLEGAEAQAVLGALGSVLSPKRTRPGDQVRLERAVTDGAFRSLSWRQGPADEYLVRPCPTGLCGGKREVAITRQAVLVSVSLRSSVSEALHAAGHDTALVAAAADVLAWDVDFYQDVRGGDSLKLVVERVEADGRFLRHGEVLAAEYEGKVAGRKRLFRYTDPDGDTGYFDDAGTSARRGFLRAPVPYVNLTSRFGSRRHPLLGYVRAHQGVDYGAPEGTPVWAVGDGVVSLAGWSGGCGLTVQVRHRNGFESVYCHLSRVNVAAGARVGQKQVVGRVGTTGLSTGPHLHYAIRQGGRLRQPAPAPGSPRRAGEGGVARALPGPDRRRAAAARPRSGRAARLKLHLHCRARVRSSAARLREQRQRRVGSASSPPARPSPGTAPRRAVPRRTSDSAASTSAQGRRT